MERKTSTLSRFGQVKVWCKSQKMDMDTSIQPSRKLLRRAEEAPMKVTSHGHRRIPLESVDRDHEQKSTTTLSKTWTKTSRPDLQQWKSRSPAMGSPDLTTAARRSKRYLRLFSTVFYVTPCNRSAIELIFRKVDGLLEKKITHNKKKRIK